MKKLHVLTVASMLAISGTVLAQSYSLQPGRPAIYDPAAGPLPPERRFVMTREGAEEARYNAQKPESAVVTTSAPIRKTYALPERVTRTVVSAPAWFVNLPEDTADMTFSVGTATSTDEQMAYDKARMAAERKLVEQAYARITTQTSSYRADRGGATIENYQQVTRKNARGELSGAQRVDSQVTHDGQYYKVYVLLRLPLGDANLMQTRRDQARMQREADIRSRAAERDMDANEARDVKIEQNADKELERRLTPQSQVAPVTVPETVKTSEGEIKLLDVDNAEYRQKRAEALAKPNAVVGQTTLR